MATKAKKRSNGSSKASRRASSATSKRSNSLSTSARREWTATEDKSLKTLIKQNTPTGVIGLKLKRARRPFASTYRD